MCAPNTLTWGSQSLHRGMFVEKPGMSEPPQRLANMTQGISGGPSHPAVGNEVMPMLLDGITPGPVVFPVSM